MTEKELLQALAEDYKSNLRRPGEFTTAELAERIGISINQAVKFLEMQAKTGRLTKRKILDDGKWAWAWSEK